MSINLVQLVESQLDRQAVQQLSDLLGEKQDDIKVGLHAAVPSLLASLTQVSKDANGAQLITTLLNKLDANKVAHLTSALTMHQTKLMYAGSKMLHTILGKEAHEVLVNLMADYSGLAKEAASNILGAIGPTMLGLIKRHLVTNNSLNADAVTELMESQQPFIAAAIPSNFATQFKAAGLAPEINRLLDTFLEWEAAPNPIEALPDTELTDLDTSWDVIPESDMVPLDAKPEAKLEPRLPEPDAAHSKDPVPEKQGKKDGFADTFAEPSATKPVESVKTGARIAGYGAKRLVDEADRAVQEAHLETPDLKSSLKTRTPPQENALKTRLTAILNKIPKVPDEAGSAAQESRLDDKLESTEPPNADSETGETIRKRPFMPLMLALLVVATLIFIVMNFF